MVAVHIWCDGACEPINPGGTGTWGFVVDRFGETEEYSGLCGVGKSMSNNVAEYQAVAEALCWVRLSGLPRGSRVVIHGDSKLWVEQMSGRWKAHEGLYYHMYARARREENTLKLLGIQLEYKWIPREQNEAADKLTKDKLAELGVETRTH